jgi:hypothetical protein
MIYVSPLEQALYLARLAERYLLASASAGVTTVKLFAKDYNPFSLGVTSNDPCDFSLLVSFLFFFLSLGSFLIAFVDY